MNRQALNLEALKLIKEWSIWMVAVQTALLTFLAGASGLGAKLDSLTAIFAGSCFTISILAASWVLSGLPYIVICLSETRDDNIYFMPLSSAPVLKSFKLWQMAVIQHVGFALGILTIALRLYRSA